MTENPNKNIEPQETLEEVVGDSQEKKPVDPFARLQKDKKRVARPRQLQVTGTTKRGSKLSPKVFLVGCLIFVIVFLGLAYAGLYFAITSSEVLQSIGLEVDSVKSVLMIFAWLFFGLIFLGGFYVLVLNIYRLITVKSKSKIKYGAGVFLGFILIVATIIGGVISIERIRSIGGIVKINTNLVVAPRVQTGEGQVLASDGIPLIAPLKMRFQLNKSQFDANILRKRIGNNIPVRYDLNCGNGQIISAGGEIYSATAQGGYFTDHCLYLEKGDYMIELTVTYIDKQTNETRDQTFTITGLATQAEIIMEPTDGVPELNDKKTENIIGVAPVTVDFKAQKLFSDLQLGEDQIVWDFDGDRVPDIRNNAFFSYPFSDSKLHTVAYQLPGHPQYGDTWFTFDLRVIESELAQCNVDITSVDGDTRYKFVPEFDELVDVDTYHYTIYDTSRDTIMEKTRKITEDSYSYTFTQGGNYQIQVSYFTPEGLKGSCRPENLIVGFAGNTVDFTTRYKQDPSEPFVDEGEGRVVVVDEVNREVVITSLPVTLELTVDAVRPDPNAKVQLYYDGRQIFADRSGVFEVAIGNLGRKDLEFVTTTAQGKEDRQPYVVDVSRSPLRATIIVEPSVGEDPLEVTLDASVSDLYDEEDEIVYFTWDFGDGESRTNVSQGKIKHTYTYDSETDTGEYYPAVTVKTRKGFTDTYRVETPVIIKKTQKEVEISVDSHPTRQSRINDIVTYSVQTDGAIDRIEWDFGNGKAFGCNGRTCATAPVQYSEAGTYEVKAEVFYTDDVPVVGRTTVRVY